MNRFILIITFLQIMNFAAFGQWNITIDTIILNPVQITYKCNAIVSQEVKLAFSGNSDYPVCTSPLKITFSLSTDAGTFNGVAASDVVTGDWKPYFSYIMNGSKTLLRATQIAPIPTSLASLNTRLKLSTKMGSPLNGNFGSSGQISISSGGTSCEPGTDTDPQDNFAYTTVSLDCVLPVLLKSFQAEKFSETSKVSWESIIESNFAYYSIEHSTNASQFLKLASILGKGNNSAYDYVHTNPAIGLNYYRLKMVDVDGSYVYSDVKAIDFSTNRNSQLNLYPNPFSQVFTVSNLQSPSKITIYDFTGKMVRQINSSDNNLLIDLSQQSSGIYSVMIKDQFETKVFRVIKAE